MSLHLNSSWQYFKLPRCCRIFMWTGCSLNCSYLKMTSGKGSNWNTEIGEVPITSKKHISIVCELVEHFKDTLLLGWYNWAVYHINVLAMWCLSEASLYKWCSVKEIFIVRLGLNVALTHQNRSYRDKRKSRGTEKEAEMGKQQEEDSSVKERLNNIQKHNMCRGNRLS